MDESTINLCEAYKLYERNEITINQFIFDVIRELKPHTKRFSYLKTIISQLRDLAKMSHYDYAKSELLETIMEDFYSYCDDNRIEVISNYWEPDDDYYL